MKLPLYLILLLLLSLAIAGGGCHRHGEAWDAMSRAEHLMEEHPDSALAILDSIPADHLNGGEERARHALLLSMALDKNYVDLTTLDTLQPAIDYYLRHGSPDDKLRTYYYQARIYQNQGNDDEAMKALLKARDLAPHVTDSLTYAKLLVVHGNFLSQQYQPEEALHNYLDAAKIYGKHSNANLELKNYIKVLNCLSILNRNDQFEKVLAVCDSLLETNEIVCPLDLYTNKLIHYDDLRDTLQIKKLLKHAAHYDLSLDLSLELAHGFSIIGVPDSAKKYLSQIDETLSIFDSLKYDAVSVAILENEGKYKEAYLKYKDFSAKLETYQDSLLKSGVLFEEEKHKLEIDNLNSLRKREHIIVLCLCVVVILGGLGGILLYRIKIARSKRAIAEKEQLRLQQEKEIAILERDNNALQADKLRIEKEQLESRQREYELESRHLKSEQIRLEGEKENLLELLQNQADKPSPITDVIKMRLEMLNQILVKDLVKNGRDTPQYEKWISQIHNDKETFLNNTRLAFSATHPDFIKLLESKGLDNDDINYLCLFALGFNVKEVGYFMDINSNYTRSSKLRKKLNLPENSTPLAQYIRSLLG